MLVLFVSFVSASSFYFNWNENSIDGIFSNETQELNSTSDPTTWKKSRVAGDQTESILVGACYKNRLIQSVELITSKNKLYTAIYWTKGC